MERERRMKERSTSGGWEGGSYGDLKSGDCQALATHARRGRPLNRRRQRLYKHNVSFRDPNHCFFALLKLVLASSVLQGSRYPVPRILNSSGLGCSSAKASLEVRLLNCRTISDALSLSRVTRPFLQDRRQKCQKWIPLVVPLGRGGRWRSWSPLQLQAQEGVQMALCPSSRPSRPFRNSLSRGPSNL
jgi:hypothetical protein